MRAKRAKTSSRTKRPARATRSRKPGAAGGSPQVAWDARARAIVLGVFSVVVAVALLSAREETPRPAGERGDMPIAAAALGMDIPLRTETTTPAAAKPAPPAVEREPAAFSGSKSAHDEAPAFAETPALVSRAFTDTRMTPEAQPESAAAVTVSGCLESDGGEFRLTDVSGAGAPTARSWKSGFLRKRTASVELEDAVGTLSLRNYIGRRISTNGTLIDREMHARTVRVVGACD